MLDPTIREACLSEKFFDLLLALRLSGSVGPGKFTAFIGGETWKSLSGKVSEDAVFTVFALYDRIEAAELLVSVCDNDDIVAAEVGTRDGDDVDIVGVGGMVIMRWANWLRQITILMRPLSDDACRLEKSKVRLSSKGMRRGVSRFICMLMTMSLMFSRVI